MKFPNLIILAGLLPSAAVAGDHLAKAVIETPAAASRWTFGASFAPLLNAKADFSGQGAFSSPFTPQPLGGGQDYEYDDGFVFVDGSDNAGGLTSYWGYDDASQYDSTAETLSFNITRSLQSGRAGETEDISPGFEFFGYLDMGRIADFSGRPVSWGFKTGLHYANISTGGSGSLTSDILRVTDTYDASGISVLMPPPGYSGPQSGAGQLLPDSPSRTSTVIADGAFISGERNLDLDMITLSAGPYIQLPVADKFSVSAEAGLSLSIARGEYDFESSTTIAPLGTQTASGSDTRTVLLPGAYAGVSAVWQLTERFGLHGSARYQYIDQFEIGANGTDASISFDGAAILSLGGVWNF